MSTTRDSIEIAPPPAVLSAHGVGKVYGRATFMNRREPTIALDNVDIRLMPGRTLGIVGESGCGKSTLSRILVGITPASSGTVRVEGEPITAGTKLERRTRLTNVQMVFQSPAGSLDPRMRVADIVAEPLQIHRRDLSAGRKRELVLEILRRVGLSEEHLARFPHELSGGQQQRVGIARALIIDPKVVICDEAVSALDVSVQAQIINLLLDMQKSTGVAYIFISHDLGAVAAIADEIAVMYMGRVVEEGSAEVILTKPEHPYTALLLESSFVPDPQVERARVRGRTSAPSQITERPTQGCAFRPRCKIAVAECATHSPELAPFSAGGVRVACHNVRKAGEGGRGP